MLVICIWKLRWKVWRLFAPSVCNGGIFCNFSVFSFIMQLSHGTKTIVHLLVLQAPLFWTEVRFCRLRVLRSLTLAFISVWLSTQWAQLSCFTVFRFMVSITKLTKNTYMHHLCSFQVSSLLSRLTITHHTIILEDIRHRSSEGRKFTLLFFSNVRIHVLN